MVATGDLGLLPESELQERMRPGGRWQTTATPTIRLVDGLATLACETPGASIAYRCQAADEKTADSAVWSLYVGPVAVPAGRRLVARASRLGFRDSPAAKAEEAGDR
jgi:uncharacterized sulfatase